MLVHAQQIAAHTGNTAPNESLSWEERTCVTSRCSHTSPLTIYIANTIGGTRRRRRGGGAGRTMPRWRPRTRPAGWRRSPLHAGGPHRRAEGGRVRRQNVSGAPAVTPEHWRDTILRIEGPAVEWLRAAFVENWLATTTQALGGAAYFPRAQPRGSVAAQVV